MGPMEIKPATIENMTPLRPDLLPRIFTMWTGLKKRFRLNKKIKAKPKGIMILKEIRTLFEIAVMTLLGAGINRIP